MAHTSCCTYLRIRGRKSPGTSYGYTAKNITCTSPCSWTAQSRAEQSQPTATTHMKSTNKAKPDATACSDNTQHLVLAHNTHLQCRCEHHNNHRRCECSAQTHKARKTTPHAVPTKLPELITSVEGRVGVKWQPTCCSKHCSIQAFNQPSAPAEILMGERDTECQGAQYGLGMNAIS